MAVKKKKKLCVVAGGLCVIIMLLVSWTLHSDDSTSNHIATVNRISDIGNIHIASDVDQYWRTHGGDITCNVSVRSAQVPSPNKKNLSTALNRWRKRVFSIDTDLSTEKFTIVLLTYRKESILPFLLQHYCETQQLAKIVVIWNDIERGIPDAILNLRKKCRIPLEFIRETVNKKTNRFKPRQQIETDCVFILDDDDQLISDVADLTFTFNIWQENRHCIVGFDEWRSHSRNSPRENTYLQPVRGHGVSVMRTATGFLHRAYLEMYFDSGDLLPEGMMKEHDWTTCDDILMNCVVGRFLELVSRPQSSLLVLKDKEGLKNLEANPAKAGGHLVVHTMQPDHYKQRCACVNKIATILGHLPRQFTKIIIQGTT